jgi:hypothetical protein
VKESFSGSLESDDFFQKYAANVDRGTNGSDLDKLRVNLEETQTKLGTYTGLFEKSPSDTLAGLMASTEQAVKVIRKEIDNTTTILVGETPI